MSDPLSQIRWVGISYTRFLDTSPRHQPYATFLKWGTDEKIWPDSENSQLIKPWPHPDRVLSLEKTQSYKLDAV